MPETTNENLNAELICSITMCRQLANRLGHRFLADLLSAALIEAGMRSVGGIDVLSHPEKRLDRLIEMKLKLALARNGGNIVSLPDQSKFRETKND